MGKSRKSRSDSRSYSRSPSKGQRKERNFHSRAVKIFYEHSSREDSPLRRERERKRTRSRSNSKHRRYERSSTKQKKRDSRSRSSSRGKRVIFDFEVFLETQYIKRLTENNEYIIKRIKSDSGIYRIDFDHELSIPGLDGSVIKLSDDSYTRKSDALFSILKEIQYQKGSDRSSRRDYYEHSVTILVPEGMVSLLIGSKGKQINNIMRESRAHVIVNPAIHKMTYRTVKIDGKPEYIASACKIIYKTLEKVSPNVEKIEKTPKPLELHKTRITAKLVFPKNSVGFIIGKEGSWIKDLCDKCCVSIKFQQDDSIRCVKDDEAICIIKGKLSGVINAIVIILRRAHEYENISKHYASDVIKLLIPNNFVNKLIGAKGCMIREIAAKSGGAQIKIMSDKQTEREYQDCVVAIAGSLANKQDAVCYILEQIEIFKNGGPILVNGKAINDNLAQQFRHSIPPRDSAGNQRRSSIDELNEPYIKEEDNMTDEEYYSSRGTQEAKRRSRSRSIKSHYSQDNELSKPVNNRKMSEEVGENIKSYEAYPPNNQDNNIIVKVENENMVKQEQTPISDPRAEKYKKLNQSFQSEKRDSDSPINEKASPSRNSAKHYIQKRHSRSRSRSKSNSYSRSRSRSKSLSVRDLANRKSRSPSISKNYKSYYAKEEYHKDSPRSKQLLHGSERKDVTKNSHYVDSKGDMRITTTVIVPNYLVPYLIGKNGEVIKNIETKTTSKISFQRENKNNDSVPVNTAEGIRGRIVSIAGPLSSMIEAFGLLTDEIIKLEKSINGTRYEKS